MNQPPQKKLGRYDLVRVLGKGAMGIVYEGRDPNLDRRVAIKTVKVENLTAAAASEYESRFRTEARSAARLQHPNIVSVYDSDRDGDTAFLVMEFIQGEDLKHHLDSGRRYSVEETVRMVCELLDALDYAHRQSIVHRDIKPANLLLEPSGRVKLTDFGVARIQDGGEATRTQGGIIGTLKYMSPEQVRGMPVDARADLFSVGVVLYQLLADKRPFDGDNDFSIIHQIISEIPEPPSTANAQLPPAIDAVVSRALAKDRNDRFQTAADFQRALRNALHDVADTTVIPPPGPRRAEGASATPSRGTSASSASRGVGGSSGTSGTSGTSATSGTSTVTQELELVYWKEIKDSSDVDELQGFLDRFPTGIYADLARKRLKRLAEPVSVTDDATMAGPLPATARVTAAGDDITRMPGRDSTSPGSPASVDPAQAEDAARAAAAAHQALPPTAGGRRNALIGVVVALVAVAAGVGVWLSRPAAPPAGASPAAATASAPAPAADAAASGAVASASAASAPASVPASAAATMPARVASAIEGLKARVQAARGASTPAPAPVATPTPAPAPAPAQAAAPAPEPSRPAPASAPSQARSGNPKDACEGKMFLTYQLCLNEQCLKSQFQAHPICVERREMERARREAEANR